MKKIDLGQTIQILANVGVIAGIAFLGFELQQNNELLRADARGDQRDARTYTLRLILSSPELIDAAFKNTSGESLTDRESFIVRSIELQRLINWEWQFGEYQAGALALDELPVGAWRGNMRNSPWLREVWSFFRNDVNSEFRAYVDENVLPDAQ